MSSASPAPSNRELLAMVRAWCQENYPGCPFEYLDLHLRFLPVPIQLADSPTTPAIHHSNGVDHSDEKPIMDDCIRAILKVLRAKQPLTKIRLFEEMDLAATRGEIKEHSESTIMRRIAQLMADGTVENPPGVKPAGYRVVE